VTLPAMRETDMSEKAWKVKDVAEFLQASESWVRHAAAEGRLPCRKICGLLRFDPAEIRALVAAPEGGPRRSARRDTVALSE
jgi:predicted DNA-binding transcriptional regulator AlpA